MFWLNAIALIFPALRSAVSCPKSILRCYFSLRKSGKSAFMRTAQSSIAFLIPNPKGRSIFSIHISQKRSPLFLFTRAHIQLVNMITYQQNRCTIVRI
ncbi:hypothetical protein [Microcoleus sp. T2B6]|uniref:hypothetical protein n=1 Tax=Microcoleus sp. T2B6 TaxID=3055424 RepID=UPI002FD751EE